MKTKLLTSLAVGLGTALAGAGASSAAILEQTAPVFTSYVESVHYNEMGLSGVGDVTASLLSVDLGSGNSGCEAADFAGFAAGSIALIERGTCFFDIKAANAAAAGAIGALIFNNVDGLFSGTLLSLGDIPVISLSRALGLEFAASAVPVTIRMQVTETSEIPEPGMLGLLGLGLAGLGVARRRKQQAATA